MYNLDADVFDPKEGILGQIGITAHQPLPVLRAKKRNNVLIALAVLNVNRQHIIYQPSPLPPADLPED